MIQKPVHPGINLKMILLWYWFDQNDGSMEKAHQGQGCTYQALSGNLSWLSNKYNASYLKEFEKKGIIRDVMRDVNSTRPQAHISTCMYMMCT